jgi:hypothetical protein
MPAYAREPHLSRFPLKGEKPFTSVDTTPPHLKAAEDRLREKPENANLLPKPRKKGKKVDVQVENPCPACGEELDSLNECPSCEEAVVRAEAPSPVDSGDDGGARLKGQLAEEDRVGPSLAAVKQAVEDLKSTPPEVLAQAEAEIAEEDRVAAMLETPIELLSKPTRPTDRRHGFKYSTPGEPAVVFLPPGLTPADLDCIEEMFHIVMRQARRAVGAPLAQTLESKS